MHNFGAYHETYIRREDGDWYITTFSWIPADKPDVKVSPMPKMGVGSPWNRFELTDVGIAAEYVRDLSELVKAANSSTSPAQAKYQRTPSQQWF